MSEMDMSEKNLSVPLKPAVFHILLALAEEDRHGYAIMQKVREQSGGQIPLQTGSFYRHLSKLIEAGLVGEAAVRTAPADPRRGTHYKLTAPGRAALMAEKRRLMNLLAAVDQLRPASTRRGQS